MATIDVHKEILEDLESDFPARIFVNGNGMVNAVTPPHWHDYIEILFVLDGEPHIKVGTDVYHPRKNDLFFIQNNVFHATTCDTVNMGSLLVIMFHPRLINIGLPQSIESHYFLELINADRPDHHYLQNISATQEALYKTMLDLLREFTNKEYGYEMMIKGLLYKLLGELARQSIIENRDFTPLTQKMNSISIALQFIDEHYAEPLSLQRVAEHCHYNYYYLSRLFKEIMGRNFKDYLDFVRVREAERLLNLTSMKISDIAFQVGFGCIASMNRIFKKIKNVNPSEYRKLK